MRVRRPYQIRALAAAREVRQLGLDWSRRARKSTTLGDLAFDELSKEPGRMVVGASASLLLGRELVTMSLTALEQSTMVMQEAAAVRAAFENGAEEKGLDFKIADADKDKVLAGLTPEDFASLYQSRKMELRLYFDKTRYSREQIVAPNPQTMRGWRGKVLFDEFGYIPKAQAEELRIAADPMMRDTPDLAMIYACNLPLDDRHPWFEMTLPRESTAATEEDQFPPNANGHFYIGQQGILIHRVALKDAYAAGHLLYDDYGQPMNYEQCRKFPQMRGGWDISYALNHKPGGASVIDLIALVTAQRRGIGQCSFCYVDSDAEFRHGLDLLRANLKDGQVGIGFDVATTTGELSNPSSVTVTERIGSERFQRLVCIWKEKKPQIARERLAAIVAAVKSRPQGGGARRLGIDASNERYFAEETADLLAAQVPVQLVIAGNTVEPRPTGYSEKDGNINYKTYLGDLHAASINDGRVAVPADEYLKTDYRMVMKDGGRYVCTPDTDGKHGDTFDSGKLADFMLLAGDGCLTADNVKNVSVHGGTAVKFKPRHFIPRRFV
jgi:hypothetical protein